MRNDAIALKITCSRRARKQNGSTSEVLHFDEVHDHSCRSARLHLSDESGGLNFLFFLFFKILDFPLTLGSASCVSGCRPSPFTWLCAATRCTRVVDFTWKLEIKKYNFKGWKIHLINFDEVGARLSRRGRSRITAVHFWFWICGFLFGKMEEKNRKIWQENANSEKNGLDSKFVAHICGRSLGGAFCTIGAWRVRLQFESIPPTNPLASLFSVSVSSAFLWPLLIFQHIPLLFLPPAVCLLYSPLFSLHFPIFVAIR